MSQGILNEVGFKRIMSFFDGKKLIGKTKNGVRIYLDPQCSFGYSYAPNWGKDLTPDIFRGGVIVVCNRMEAELAFRNNR